MILSWLLRPSYFCVMRSSNCSTVSLRSLPVACRSLGMSDSRLSIGPKAGSSRAQQGFQRDARIGQLFGARPQLPFDQHAGQFELPGHGAGLAEAAGADEAAQIVEVEMDLGVAAQ